MSNKVIKTWYSSFASFDIKNCSFNPDILPLLECTLYHPNIHFVIFGGSTYLPFSTPFMFEFNKPCNNCFGLYFVAVVTLASWRLFLPATIKLGRSMFYRKFIQIHYGASLVGFGSCC